MAKRWYEIVYRDRYNQLRQWTTYVPPEKYTNDRQGVEAFVSDELDGTLIGYREADTGEVMMLSLNFKETRKLLVDLAVHFSEDTRRVIVPLGTKEYIVEIFPKDSQNDLKVIKTIRIPLVPFFGMMVGYNSESDILVFEDKEPKR